MVLRDNCRWPSRVEIGDEIGLGGMRYGYQAAIDVEHHLLVGNRSALAAVCAIVESLPASARVTAILEDCPADERALLPERPGTSAHWTSTGRLPDAVETARKVTAGPPDIKLHAWIAGEVGIVRAVRCQLANTRGISRLGVQSIVYWERGRTADERDATVLQRYQRAITDGRDITDQDVVDQLELDE